MKGTIGGGALVRPAAGSNAYAVPKCARISQVAKPSTSGSCRASVVGVRAVGEDRADRAARKEEDAEPES